MCQFRAKSSPQAGKFVPVHSGYGVRERSPVCAVSLGSGSEEASVTGSHDQTEEQGVRESLHIDAKPEAVYEAISDVTRMGEWSPEATGAVVLTSGPITTGTRFRGTNQRSWAKWATQCTVVAADPGRCFAFEVRALGG